MLVFVFLILSLPVFAEEFDEDWVLFGIEGEKLFNLCSGALALLLFVLTAVAYSRTRNGRLLYVSFAFFLYAIKGVLLSLELFFGEWGWVDPVAAVLDFFILLCFFRGILKK